MPSKYLSLLGVQVMGSMFDDYSFSAFAEYSDTAAGSLNKAQFGAAYEHSVYRGGYHYRDRALGSTFDGDARTLHFGAKVLQFDGSWLFLSAYRTKLNRAGRGRSNTLSASSTDIRGVDMRFAFLWRDLSVSLIGSYQDGDRLLQERDDVRFGAIFEYRY